jgi:dolichyl-phosphate beta-glucosyltransferase
MDVSIVIPAFNEAGKIARDVEEAARFLEKGGFSGEVIVVDDGSSDGTAEIARGVTVPSRVRFEVIRLDRNSGKGQAVRTGVLKSAGEVVLYADSGMCVPFLDALPSIGRIRAGTLDAGFGSRKLEGTVICQNRPLRRRILSGAFHLAAVLVTGLPRRISDSQCGFKVYRGKIARELYSGLETHGFLFELEIILKALGLDCAVEDFPVTWTCDLDTRIRPGSQAFQVLRELFAVRRRVRMFKKG